MSTVRIHTDEVRALAERLARLRAIAQEFDKVDKGDCAYLAHSEAAGKLAGALNDWDDRRRKLEAALEFLGEGLRIAAQQYDALEARIIKATGG